MKCHLNLYLLHTSLETEITVLHFKRIVNNNNKVGNYDMNNLTEF